jgi:hypothetical protein
MERPLKRKHTSKTGVRPNKDVMQHALKSVEIACDEATHALDSNVLVPLDQRLFGQAVINCAMTMHQFFKMLYSPIEVSVDNSTSNSVKPRKNKVFDFDSAFTSVISSIRDNSKPLSDTAIDLDKRCEELYYVVTDTIDAIKRNAGQHATFERKKSALFTLMKIAKAMLTIKDKRIRERIPSYFAKDGDHFAESVARIFFAMFCDESWEMCNVMMGERTMFEMLNRLAKRLDRAGFFMGLNEVMADVKA